MIFGLAKTRFVKRLSEKIASILYKPMPPRLLQEKKDLYTSILTFEFKKTREAHGYRFKGRGGHLLSVEETNAMIDEATVQLMEYDYVEQMTMSELRRKLQETVAPMTKSLFEHFHEVDQLLTPNDTDDDDDPNGNDNGNGNGNGNGSDQQGRRNGPILPPFPTHEMQQRMNKDPVQMKELLLEEFDQLQQELSKSSSSLSSSSSSSSLAFRLLKRGAIKTVLDYHQWIEPSSLLDGTGTGTPHFVTGTSSTANGMDEFGYFSTANSKNDNSAKHVNKIMMYGQCVNLAMGSLLRKRLGYSTLALRSLIPGAGRGIYADGPVSAGSIVGFFPGQVWPLEPLAEELQKNPKLLDDDDNYMITARYDQIFIDSRNAPSVVLDGHSSNPWAVAHLANHPPRHSQPNCRHLPVNFTDEMGLEEALKKYVPNTYAKKPWLLGRNERMTRDNVYMNGMLLVTTRDVEDEELVYDYRFNPSAFTTETDNQNDNDDSRNNNDNDNDSHDDDKDNGTTTTTVAWPEWYHAVDEEEAKNRWSKEI